MKVPQSHIDDMKEQREIEAAIWSAIPVGASYSNILRAITRVLERCVHYAFVEDDAEGGDDQP